MRLKAVPQRQRWKDLSQRSLWAVPADVQEQPCLVSKRARGDDDKPGAGEVVAALQFLA